MGVEDMKKMQCLGSFVANLAKGRDRRKVVDYQQNNAYPSFIVRL